MAPSLKPPACPFCGVTGDEETVELVLAKIQSCNNCRVDLSCNGRWTGHTLRVRERLIERGLAKKTP